MLTTKRRHIKSSSSITSSPSQDSKQDDNDPNSKSKDAPIKVILSLFGLLVVVFIMFSVFEPKKRRPADHPPLRVFFNKQQNENENEQKKFKSFQQTTKKDLSYSKNEIRKDSESVDIEFIESNHQNVKEDEVEQIKDLYLTKTNPLRPPKSIHIDDLSSDETESFWNDHLNEMDIFDSSNLPSADSNGKVYVMNYIFNPYEQMMSIFLLTSEYLDPNHGLHAWPSKRRRNELPALYKNIRKTIYKDYKRVSPEFVCVFREKEHLWISKVDFVPNNTTRDRYVNHGTEILRCHVPMAEISALYEHGKSPFFDADFKFEFLLSQRWKSLVDASNQIEIDSDLVHISLSFLMGMRSGIKLFGNDDAFLLNKADQSRHFTLCMPPISEPLSFISENVAHYISNIGVEHIYIGTFFAWNKAEKDRERLIKRIKPWFDKGLVTVWPHEQPWIGFTDKAKSHWLNQCLYYAKSRDAFTLSLDADEFLVLNRIENVFHEYADSDLMNERAKMMQSVMIGDVLKNKISEFGDDHFCWLTFESYQMWQLLNANESFMLRRFVGRESKSQMTWSKVIWNNKHLHFVGYHAGGACSAQGRDWTQIVFDWREQRDAKHVYRFDPINEGAIFHFYNCRQVRIEPKDKNLRNPWSQTINDTRMIDVYWPNIENEFKTHQLAPTYPDPHSDVMTTKYYKTHYGFGNNMAVWHENLLN